METRKKVQLPLTQNPQPDLVRVDGNDLYVDILETLWVKDPPINVDFFHDLKADLLGQQALACTI